MVRSCAGAGPLDGLGGERYAAALRVLPIVAVQIAPAEAPPALEQLLLEACSTGLERARCVSARRLESQTPRGVALVSWEGPGHVSIEVGLGANQGDAPLWVSRVLDFSQGDPENERWRAVGFTIALLADDPRFWPPEPEPESLAVAPIDTPPAEPAGPGPALDRVPIVAELRGLAAAGLLHGPWRWGAEARLAVPLGSVFVVTGGVGYSLASDASVDARWFDVSAGIGVRVPSLFADVDARLRFELLAQNVAVTAHLGELTDRNTAWVPGASFGGDLQAPLGDAWLASARADVFMLDGSTGINSAGRRVAASVGAGVVLGLGAGYRF